jgi:hypothetical protein
MSSILICRKNLGIPSASCRDVRAVACMVTRLLTLTILVLFPEPKASAFENVYYPDAVIDLAGGKAPFAPANIGSSHTFPLKPLKSTGSREAYGAGIKINIETLGEKLLLVDTAARGLLLKNLAEETKNSVRAPEWIRPGPGIQTGIFRLFPGMSSGKLFMATVVAELFWAKGFQGIDGILSTEILSPWIVRLDFPEMRMELLSRNTYIQRPEWELPATLAANWWIVPVEISNRQALMLLDTGANRTYVSEQWLLKNLPPPSSKKGRIMQGNQFFEAGTFTISLKNGRKLKRMVLGAWGNQIPFLQDSAVDGVLAFDTLGELPIDLDYKGRKLYIRQER